MASRRRNPTNVTIIKSIGIRPTPAPHGLALVVPPGPDAHVPGISQAPAPPLSTGGSPGWTVMILVAVVLTVVVCEVEVVTVAVIGM
ncbi:MAG: hypothetical protein Q7R41_18545, partial [Phycisphaerales bacterium]|nr:hypothetical protein [Phycisphaerales bacterium]